MLKLVQFPNNTVFLKSLKHFHFFIQVYCDSPSPKSAKQAEREGRVPFKEEKVEDDDDSTDQETLIDDNNIIHQIERRLAEKQAQPREKVWYGNESDIRVMWISDYMNVLVA